MPPPSGEQFRLEHGSARAVVTEVGATLRSFDIGREHILWSFGEEEICSAGRGQVLLPWPNRLQDGIYEFAGMKGAAALDEPVHSNAIHGLVRWLPWREVERSPSRVTLGCTLVAQPGYPFVLRIELTYELWPTRLEVTVVAQNAGETEAPFACGFHPYVDAGGQSLDDDILYLPAQTQILCSSRGLPEGAKSVTDAPRPLRGLRLDDCFTDLERDSDGRWRVRVERAEASTVSVAGDSAFDYVMCFTGDTLDPSQQRRGIAIEPMTAPPNALRTGDSLVSLSAGEKLQATFNIEVG